MTTTRLGFVGVGRMGANIALRLRDVGYPAAAVYDVRTESAVELARRIGAEAVTKLPRITELSDVIFTVVTDDAAMYSIFSPSADSLLAGCAGKLFINCATLSPKVHVDVERLAADRGALTLEACMASSIPQARDGTLYLMVAGGQEAFDRARPLLEKMSKSLRYVGKTGDAAKVKALVNMT